jgi:hypothetical protein
MSCLTHRAARVNNVGTPGPHGNGFHDAVYRTGATAAAIWHEYLENQQRHVRRSRPSGVSGYDAVVTAALLHCLVLIGETAMRPDIARMLDECPASWMPTSTN